MRADCITGSQYTCIFASLHATLEYCTIAVILRNHNSDLRVNLLRSLPQSHRGVVSAIEAVVHIPGACPIEQPRVGL